MFDTISRRYDFLNHFLSLGIDRYWRKKAVRQLGRYRPQKVLDIATGTGDFAIATMRRLRPQTIVGLDLSEGMLRVGRQKMKRRGWEGTVEMLQGDSENLPFETAAFDGITVGFGVRNFEHLERGLSEMLRVLKPGAPAVVLEFSKPKQFPVKQAFHFYSNYIIPRLGKSLSGDGAAYTYLPKSVAAFPEGEHFMAILRKIGYQEVRAQTVSGGIATIYTGERPSG